MLPWELWNDDVNLKKVKDGKYLIFKKQNQMKKKIVFVFDFDQTLTMYHSGGLPELEVDYIERMDLLLPMLEKLNQRGIVVYINTRGIAADVKLYLKKKLDGPDKVLWMRSVMRTIGRTGGRRGAARPRGPSPSAGQRGHR